MLLLAESEDTALHISHSGPLLPTSVQGAAVPTSKEPWNTKGGIVSQPCLFSM